MGDAVGDGGAREQDASRVAGDLDQPFRMLVEGLPIGVMLVDTRGEIEYVNPRCAEYLGRELHGSLEGPEAEAVVHPEDVERAMGAWLAARSGDQPFEVEGLRLRRHDGAYRSHLARGFPLRDRSSRVTHWALCGIDLHRAHDAAAEARESELLYKDAFLAMLGHELRNPLGPIRNAAQILGMTGTLDATGSRSVAIIDRQVGHLARIVDDLLDVSRIVAGRLELARERTDLAEVVRETVEAHRAELDAASLRLQADLAGGSLMVNGDRKRLAQVVDSLLDNARKFTPPGGSVTVRLLPRGEEAAVLTVADTGIGMDAELLQRAFGVFSQGDRSLERTSGGLGLGLALVKGLVDLHGGEVRATSAGPRKGAQVVVELPLDRSRARPGDGGTTAAGGQRLRVLVVEDNVDAAESLQTLLRIAGHEVQTALSGPSGLAVAERFRPEVVLCDIGLPGMDGYAVARALRAAPATASVHLVALTGYGQDEDRRRGRDAGFDDYLTKPADFRTLQRVMLRKPVP
ncbi:MAG TPA: ATP-binding protein [Vicinamibacteria bacterium]|nr:ATP-binding protein [Vicinamibacteria bacterium]